MAGKILRGHARRPCTSLEPTSHISISKIALVLLDHKHVTRILLRQAATLLLEYMWYKILQNS